MSFSPTLLLSLLPSDKRTVDVAPDVPPSVEGDFTGRKKIFEKISHSAERRKIETLTILKDQNLLAKVNRCGMGGNERFAEQQMERKPSE